MEQRNFRRLSGAEFNRILAADPVLRELESVKYDEGAEFLALLSVLRFEGIGVRIGNLPVKEPLTAAKWVILDLFRSPFLRGGPVSTSDTDLFLYLLAQPEPARNCSGASRVSRSSFRIFRGDRPAV